MPRGLYGRAALILLMPVVTVQLIVSVVFIQRHFEGVTELMSRNVLLELTYLVDAIETAENPQAAANAIAGPLDFTLEFAPRIPITEDSRRFYDLSGRVVVETLRAGLSGIGPIDLWDGRRVRLWIETTTGPMIIDFDRNRVSASNPHQLLVIMVAMGALMTLVSYFFLRNQLRPIKRMAEAAAAFGKGRIVPYAPSGAVEVRAAGAAFLDMRNRIERQSQSRTMMLSGISHDLRTPLTRLRLALSMMDEAEAAPLVRDVEDMQRLVDAFLEFGREDASDAPVPTSPVALLRMVVADAARGGAAVTVGPVEGLDESVDVPLRPMAIRRALDNLIGNGLRYGNRVQVSLLATERTLRFRVEDDGPGIAPADRDEAIRPFARLDPARNQDRGTGVGLGLAIVADVARLHGGVLRLGDSATLGGLCADLVIAR